jgi:collagen triple helix repeat protein
MNRIRRHLSYANVAATLALLFAMSGGALAANHYLLSSTKQISPKLLKQLRGKPGPAGAQGPQGPQGNAGTAGTAGKEGKEGKEGQEGKAGPLGTPGKEGKEGKEGKPGNASVAQAFEQEAKSAVALESSAKKVLDTSPTEGGKNLALPGLGALTLVQASVKVANTSAGLSQVTCELAEEGSEEETLVKFGQSSTVDIPAGAVFAEIPLTGAVQLGGGQTYSIRVYCTVATPGKASVDAGSINAVGYE